MPARSRPAERTPLATALAMLARRPYSVAELKRALERKFPANPANAEAIARLRELGYLNDKRVAEQVAYSLAQNRAFGPHRVRRELKSKLLDYKTIEPAIERTFEEISESELLECAIEKKVRALRRPVTMSKLHSICQSLLRRGFKAGDIMKAVRARPELKPVAEDVNAEDLEAEKL